jgi:hypothetical protein
VAEAWVSRRLVEEVDQGLSARLVLSREAPDCLAANSVLVARVQSGEGWEFNGRPTGIALSSRHRSTCFPSGSSSSTSGMSTNPKGTPARST